MQVRTVSVAHLIDDGDHLFGAPPAITIRADIPLSIDELVAALFCMSANATVDELSGLTDEEVRQDVAGALAFDGLSAVQRAAEHQFALPPAPDASAYLALCERRIAAAFGVALHGVRVGRSTLG